MTVPIDALICAYDIAPSGTAEPLAWSAIKRADTPRAGGYRWIHLHHEPGAAQSWLRTESGLTPLVQDALLANETQPRCTPYGDGAILNLRGVNLNPGAEPEDMVSIRIWVERERIISVRLRKLMAVQDMRELFDSGRAPGTPGAFIAHLAFRLIDRMEPEIIDLADKIDALEDLVLDASVPAPSGTLADLRRTAVILRRFIAPQRDALNRLSTGTFTFIEDTDRLNLREAADRVTRIVEELDAVRERAAVIHDQLSSRRAEDMNRHMLLLSIAAAIFLPLTFLTGLLGMNVGGLPWSNEPSGFLLVVVICIALGTSAGALFRRMRWI